jgi:MFS transporter, PPP family, 3-phenylpropionic acid transporter
LSSNALDSSQIGIILAAPLIARLIANPIITDIADRRGAVDATLAASAFLVLIGTLGLTSVATFWPILGIVFFIGLAQGPLIALTDAYAWAKLRERVVAERREHLYGLIRLWGSLGFILASVGAGHALDGFRPGLIIWLLAAAAAVLFVAAASITQSERRAAKPAWVPEAQPAEFHRLALIVVGAALIQASHATYYAFSSLHWVAEGKSGTEIGTLWSVGVVAEIAFFALGGRIFWRLGGPFAVLFLGAAAAVLRWTTMSFDPPLALLMAMQALHASTFGATHLGSVAAISRMAPARLQARAQGWLAALWAGSQALLTTLSGTLYPRLGERTYLLMSAVAIVALGLIVLAGSLRVKPVST